MATNRSLELAARIWNWKPHSDGQTEFLLCPAKVKTAACGRRWGKSEAVAVDIALYAIANPNSIQFTIAPTDDQSKIIMGQVSRFLNAIPGMTHEITEVKSPYHQISFKDSTGLAVGTTIKARTAGTSGKGIRGNKAHRVILDEAAFILDSIVDEAISPLLADFDGNLVKISTPFGRGHFHRDYLLGLDPANTRYASFQFPTTDNPYISAEYIESQRKTKPDRVFRQEYLAEFLDDAGGVFRGVSDLVVKGRTGCQPRGRVYIGIDLAKYEDFTVMTAVDESGSQVAHERFTGIPWSVQIQRIAAFVARFRDAVVYVDSTGVGDPIFEQLSRIPGAYWHGYNLTNQTKEDLINALVIQIEQTSLALLDLPEQTAELQAYQYEITPSRNVRMNAPAGMHDDCVIALALACWGLRDPSGVRFEDEMSLYN